MKKLIQFEMKKIFAKRLTQAAVAAALLLAVFLEFSSYQNMYAFDGAGREGRGRQAVEIDKGIAEKYAGTLTDEKVRQIMEDFKPAQDLHGMNAAYIYQNAMQAAAFRRFSDLEGNWNGRSVSDVFGHETIKIGYTYGWLRTSQDMVKVFIFLQLVIIVMLAPVFSGEYGGVDNIILTSRYGRTKCAAAKAIGSVSASLAVTTVVSAVGIVFAIILYGSNGLDCSILFAPAEFVDGYIPFNITCGAMLKYQILLAFSGTVSVTGITLILSAICKNQMTALAVSAALYFLPAVLPVPENSALFKLIAFLPLYNAQFVSLMSISQMGNGLLYSLWAVPVAAAAVSVGIGVSCRVFARHQVL